MLGVCGVEIRRYGSGVLLGKFGSKVARWLYLSVVGALYSQRRPRLSVRFGSTRKSSCANRLVDVCRRPATVLALMPAKDRLTLDVSGKPSSRSAMALPVLLTALTTPADVVAACAV